MSFEENVHDALFDVIDPELGINVMDLGLVYGVSFDDDNNVNTVMTLTTPGCPLHDNIKTGVKHRVSQIEGVGDVNVSLVWKPAWTPAEMSDRAKKMLGFA